MSFVDSVRMLGVDPFVSTVVVGVVWPFIQAALDKPFWTQRRRVTLVVAVALVVSFGVWFASSYPFMWEQIVAQAGVFLGVAWSAYQVLAQVRINGVRIVDWVGAATPGGEARANYTGRHLAETDGE